MGDRKQNNISGSFVHLKTINTRQSTLHASRVTKIKPSLLPVSRNQVQSNMTSCNGSSIIRATIGSRRNDEHQTNETLNITKKRSPYIIQSNGNQIRKIPLRQSATRSHLNNWNIDRFNKTIKASGSFLSTQKYNTHQQSQRRNDSFKLSRRAHSDGMTSLKSDHPTIFNETKKRKYFNKSFPCTCSIPCILCSLLIGLLLAGAVVGSIVGVLMSSKKSTTSTTLITTTVVPTVCSCLCSNETWLFDSGYLARWSFDGILNDLTNTYNATSYNYPSFVPDGYVNQALLFNASLIQSLFAPYIALAYTSFTVEVWLKPTSFPNLIDSSIFGLCPSAEPYECLHLLIRKTGSKQYLYFGFFADDCQGNTSLTANQWIHAAFVFDITTLTQSVYLNGILDNSCIASSAITASSGMITIGTIPAIIPINNVNFYEGYMDHLTVTKRAKSSCEILEDATLAGCFLFDAAAPYIDFGPNSLLSSGLSTSIISPGHTNEAVSFNGTSYLQVASLTALGLSTKPFSMALWIRPRSVLGTIIHVSSYGNGKGWCIPVLGITANGSIVAQIYNAGSIIIWGPSIPMAPVWSHIVQTWSSTNGVRLYINGTVVTILSSAVVYAASGVSNFITLSSSLNGAGYCLGGGLGYYAPGPLTCDMDDFRVYSRELTLADVTKIYYSR